MRGRKREMKSHLHTANDLTHDLVMRAVAEALTKGQNVNQKELLKQVPGITKTALNSMVERMKKRLRSARRAHEAKLSKTAAVQSFVQQADTDLAASLLLRVSQSSPPSIVDGSHDDDGVLQLQDESQSAHHSMSVLVAENAKLQDENTKLQDENTRLKIESVKLKDESAKLQDENAKLKVEMQAVAHCASRTEDIISDLKTQLQREKTVVQAQNMELDQLRRASEEHKSSVLQIGQLNTTLEAQIQQHRTLEQKLEDALHEKSTLEGKVLILNGRLQESVGLHQKLETMEKTQETLRHANQQLQEKIDQKSNLMKKHSANLATVIASKEQAQAEMMTAQFERTLATQLEEQERQHHAALERAKRQGAEAMQDLRAKIADIDVELRELKYVAELRDVFTSVDEELVALMRKVSSVVNRDVNAGYTVLHHIEIAGYLCESAEFVKDMTKWREQRNVFCHERVIERLKNDSQIIATCYRLCDQLRSLRNTSHHGIQEAFEKFKS